jgi:uncharacterized protein YjaG (DUF416 family)
MGSDAVTQSILGSYDAQQGEVGNQNLSGKAIQSGAMQSESAAKPYMMGYITGLNRVAHVILSRVAHVILSLIPKYYVTPRTIPVMRANGIHDYETINDTNDQDSVSMKYDPHALQVKIEMGVNSSLQKQLALDYIVRLMDASELFAEFINSEGLETLLENVDIRGVDRMKVQAVEFMEKRKQAQEAQANEPSPEDKLLQTEYQIEENKVKQRAEEAELKHGVNMSELAIKQQKVDQDWFEVMAQIDAQEAKASLEAAKLDADSARSMIELSQNMLQDAMEVDYDES